MAESSGKKSNGKNATDKAAANATGDATDKAAGDATDNAPEVRPQTIYESVDLSADQIAETNATYKAMGLSAVVIDISRFVAKNDLKPNGTYKRSTIRKPRTNAGNDDDPKSNTG